MSVILFRLNVFNMITAFSAEWSENASLGEIIWIIVCIEGRPRDWGRGVTKVIREFRNCRLSTMGG